MKLNFCTLFNSSYLSRGIAMYQSLQEHCDNFHLYVFAFDDKTYHFLKNNNYKNLTVISLDEFEDDKLLKIKSTRTPAEYCWTCTPSTIAFTIERYKLDHCTYLDADLLFYSNPSILVEEMKDKSILITKHRYTDAYDQSKESGIYCVQFVTFKNNIKGLTALNWWRERCLEWCFAYAQDGKFGDQKYLDDWTERFEGVHVLQNLGGGLAPWNIQQYHFSKSNDSIIGTEISTGKKFNAVFFHFHGVRFFEKNIVSISHSLYKIEPKVKNFFYKPYIRKLIKIKATINAIDNSFNPNGCSGTSPSQAISLNLLINLYLTDLRKSLRNIFGKNTIEYCRNNYFYYSNKI